MNREIKFGIGLAVVLIIITASIVIKYGDHNVQTNQTVLTTQTSQTVGEVAKHNLATDCWVMIQGDAYDITKYLNIHPGGADVITAYCGKDATDAFLIRGGKGSHSKRAIDQLKLLLVDSAKVK